MSRLILMSVLIATMALPIIASRERDGHRGLRKTILWMGAFQVLYFFLVVFIYPRIL